jgi:hypothetical protein
LESFDFGPISNPCILGTVTTILVLFVLSLMDSDTPLISSTFSLLRNQPWKQEDLRCQKGSGLFLYVDVYLKLLK